MMRLFTIKTGRQVWTQRDRSARNADIEAFKRRAPKNPGCITMISSMHQPSYYLDTAVALHAAGYQVEEKQ